MPYVMVDVEADGPIPGDYSMICFGAVIVREGLDQVFYGRLKPISEKWVPQALAVSGFSREETLGFDDPRMAMENFAHWVAANTRPCSASFTTPTTCDGAMLLLGAPRIPQILGPKSPRHGLGLIGTDSRLGDVPPST